MNLLKTLFAFLLVLFFCSAFTKKDREEQKQVYIFGISASFLDSVVYVTNIQTLDSVKLEAGFLPNRNAYSYQMKNYFEQTQRLPNRTCAVYFSTDKKKLNKELSKLKNKYLNHKVKINTIDSEGFKFKKISY